MADERFTALPTAEEFALFREAYAETYPVRPLLNAIEDLEKRLDFATSGLGVVERRRDELKAKIAEQAETIERLRAALEWYSTAGIGTFDGGKRAHEALRGADETAVQTSAIACAHPVSNYRCPTCGIEVQSENSDAPR